MDMLKLHGHITENGELKLDLPAGLPSGEVDVTIEFSATGQIDNDVPWEQRQWTEEEIREALTFEPVSGAEIIASGVVGAWSNLGISDSATWVEELRHKEEKHWQ